MATQSRRASLTASFSVRLPESHGADLGPEQLHAEHVQALALDVDLAHVDEALEAEQGGRGGGGHAVLAGPGLGDQPALAHALGQQRLADHVVQLVRPGVGQVLALEEQPDAEALRQAAALGDRGRTAPVVLQEVVRTRRGTPGRPTRLRRPPRAPHRPARATRGRTARRTRRSAPVDAGRASVPPAGSIVHLPVIRGRVVGVVRLRARRREQLARRPAPVGRPSSRRSPPRPRRHRHPRDALCQWRRRRCPGRGLRPEPVGDPLARPRASRQSKTLPDPGDGASTRTMSAPYSAAR